LKKEDPKKATEGLTMPAQEQAIRTRLIEHHTDKENVSPLCRMCGESEETVALSCVRKQIFGSDTLQKVVPRLS